MLIDLVDTTDEIHKKSAMNLLAIRVLPKKAKSFPLGILFYGLDIRVEIQKTKS